MSRHTRAALLYAGRPASMTAIVSRVGRKGLEELRLKYGEMLSMRLSHDAGEEDPRGVRARMVALANRFPGALREIDDLELDEIRRRIAQLDAALAGPGEADPWMIALARFHALARGALSAKRWLAGRKGIDAAARSAYAAALATLPFPEDAGDWVDALDRVASPPRGRLSSLVLCRVAAELGSTEREVRELVFGASRRRQR